MSNINQNSKVWDKNDKSRTGLAIGHSHIAPDLVAVEWDDGQLSKVHEDDLLTEDDMAMELEFKDINDKLAQAAKLFKEAAQAANKHGKELNDYDYDTDEELFPAVNDLLRSMRDDAGWSTSSLRC